VVEATHQPEVVVLEVQQDHLTEQQQGVILQPEEEVEVPEVAVADGKAEHRAAMAAMVAVLYH